jgi:glycosyltransferase involved in cell wall biosynthesis
MNLLIATDHTFIQHPSGVFDTFCFDRVFFDDYCKVFESVAILCRIVKCEQLPPGAARSDDAGIYFLPIQDLHGIKWFLEANRVSRKLLHEAVDRSDAIIVRVPSQLGWLAARRAHQVGKPYMVEITGDPKRTIENANSGLFYKLIAQLEARRLRELAENASAASYVNRNTLEKFYPVHPNTPKASISSIRLHLNSITQPRIFISKLSAVRILLIASLFRYKRHSDILRAGRILLNLGVDVELDFVGDGPMREELDQLAKESGIREKIRFHGHIADRNTLNRLMDASDIFVMSSASEGLPRAMLEAMARGLPVVGANTPGIEELVRQSELYPVGDFQALGNLLYSICGDQKRLNEMSCHSIKTAELYTCEKLSPERLRLYEILREKAII